jgi:uncharacterized protein (TIGR02246 family)
MDMMNIAINASLRVALLLGLAGAMQAGAPEQDIRAVLADQTAAWNRGDLSHFVEGYLDSPTTLFIGHDIARGRGQLLARYQKAYATPEKMGLLTFSDLEVHLLGRNYANVVGRFHLKRTAAGGGDAEGVFTLLFEKTSKGWKIIQDHTS